MESDEDMMVYSSSTALLAYNRTAKLTRRLRAFMEQLVYHRWFPAERDLRPAYTVEICFAQSWEPMCFMLRLTARSHEFKGLFQECISQNITVSQKALDCHKPEV